MRGSLPIAALQVELSLVERTTEQELLPMAQALGLGWSPGLRSEEVFFLESIGAVKAAANKDWVAGCSHPRTAPNGRR